MNTEQIINLAKGIAWPIVVIVISIAITFYIHRITKLGKIPFISSKYVNVGTNDEVTLQTICSIIQPIQNNFNVEASKKIEMKEKCLDDQLEYADGVLEVCETETKNLLKEISESKNKNEEKLTEMLFLQSFDKFRVDIKRTIRKNHFVEKTNQELIDQLDLSIERHIDKLNVELQSFPATINSQIFLSKYKSIIKDAAIKVLNKAKEAAEHREQKLKELEQSFSEKRKLIIKNQLSGKYKEEDLDRYIDQLLI